MFISSALGTNKSLWKYGKPKICIKTKKRSINFGMIVLLDWLDDCMFEFTGWLEWLGFGLNGLIRWWHWCKFGS